MNKLSSKPNTTLITAIEARQFDRASTTLPDVFSVPAPQYLTPSLMKALNLAWGYQKVCDISRRCEI